MADDDLTEAELKAKQKSAKLSAATKARWASGMMDGPMRKRQATNQAKKAEKLARATQNGTAPIQPTADSAPSTTAAPAAAPSSGPHIPAPIAVSASSSATRTSGRKRKPTTRAMGGMDGANDSDYDGNLQHSFKSEYDHFQALSSPGTPALPKRKSKQMYSLAAFIASDEDDDSSY